MEHPCAISRDGQGHNAVGNVCYRRRASDVCEFVRITSKSALGWLANKGERWMPRREKAMKDAA